MRKIVTSVVLIILSGVLSAQSVFEAVGYGETTLTGTARYMSMGGALGAFGGEPTSILDNPAGVGIYRGSEITFTLIGIPSVSYSNWGKKLSADDFRFNLNNFSYIFTIPSSAEKGYLSSSFSVIYNRKRNFSRKVNVSGLSSHSITDYMANMTNGLASGDMSYDNLNTPYLSLLGYETWLISPGDVDTTQWHSLLLDGEKVNANYYSIESGYIDEYNFTYGANINNVFYYGLGLSLQSLNYSKTTYYYEKFDGGGNMRLQNNFETTGLGWNFKAGFIVRPTSFMRIGFSVQTPTYYGLRDYYRSAVKSDLSLSSSSSDNVYSESTPSSDLEYEFRSPFRLQASLGFVIQKSALIGIEYNFLDYHKSMRLKNDVNYDAFMDDPFAFENSQIDTYTRQVHAVKLGGEYRIASKYSIRAGGAYFSPAMKKDASLNLLNNTTRTNTSYFVDKGSYYMGVGLGYRYNGFGIDLAYQYRRKMENFAPYQSNATLYDQDIKGTMFGLYGGQSGESSIVSKVNTDYHNVVLTLSFKY